MLCSAVPRGLDSEVDDEPCRARPASQTLDGGAAVFYTSSKPPGRARAGTGDALANQNTDLDSQLLHPRPVVAGIQVRAGASRREKVDEHVRGDFGHRVLLSPRNRAILKRPSQFLQGDVIDP